jgi:iron complex outermembrane receptor protein
MDLSRVLGISVPDQFRLRVNYGITGNQPNDNYASMLYQGSMGSFYYNGSYVPFFNAVNNIDAGLKPEKMGEFDAGFDFSIFKSRFSGSIDYYTRTTTDLLYLATVPVPPNLYNQALVNLGKLRSSGLELTLDINVVKKTDFSYNMTFTPSYIIENSLVSLSGSFNGVEIRYGKQDLGEMGSPGQNQVPLIRVEAGKPIGQILALIFKKIDTNGSIVYADVNNNGIIDQVDRQVVGNGLPKFLFGFGNEFSYKNWDMNVLFRGVFGHDLINSYRALYEDLI